MEPLEEAIHNTVHSDKSSCGRIARTLGISCQVLRNKACPTNEHHKLALVEAMAIMQLERNYSIYRAIGLELSIDMPAASADDILTPVLALNREVGELMTAIEESNHSGAFSVREHERCQRELDDVEAAIKTLRATLSACVQSHVKAV